MNILSKFNQFFGFTQMESRFVLFLIIAFIVGLGIKAYKSTIPHEPKYNYSAMDSEFIARSQSVGIADSTEIEISNGLVDHSKKTSSPKNFNSTSDDIPILNINNASKEELIRLPGIGKAMAHRIITFRNEKGKFKSIEELKKVKGIGKKKFEQLAPFVMVGK